MITDEQLKKLSRLDKNEKILAKTSEEDMKIINDWIKNNQDRVIHLGRCLNKKQNL